MHSLIKACLSQPRAMSMVFLLLLYIGVQSFISIPKEAEPDVQIPIIYISMVHEGISPADAERLLVRPMEKELKSIEGVKEMTAVASQGHASVTLKFNAGFNSDLALQDVREKVDVAKSELPDDTLEPTVSEVNLSLFPVINVIMTGTLPEPAMLKIAKSLRDKIEEISDVLEVKIAGDREEVVNILVDPVTLENYGLTSEIIQNVTRNNLLVAAGTLSAEEGRFTVKVPSLLEDLDDIYNLPLKVSNESVVSIADVATLQKYFKDPTSIARVNGQPAVVLEVSKRTGSNIIHVTDAVRTMVEAEKRYLPTGLNILYSGDKSQNIRNNLVDLQNNLIIAVFLVLVVVILFSGLEAGLFVATSVPGAFLIGVLVLDGLSLTMNMVVLFSLILSIGMLVDAAIVVVEYANRRMLDGANHKEAYNEAAHRMAWPLFASTLTTLIVFTPLLFWPGVVGQFMKYLPLTLIATLSGSFVMAILFLPTFASLLKRRKTTDIMRHEVELIETGDVTQLRGFMGSYARLLTRLVQRPFMVISAILLALVAAVAGYVFFGNGTEFFPDIEPENAQIIIRARGNLSIYEQDTIVKDVESRIVPYIEGVRVFYTSVGNDGGKQQGLTEDTIGIIQMEFSDWKTRKKAAAIFEDVLTLTKDMPGVVVEARAEEAGPGSGKPINIEISSRYPDAIKPVAEKIIHLLQKTPNIVDIENNLPVPGIEWKMDIDRAQALRFGVDMRVLGNFIRLVTNGLKVTSYRPDDSDDEVDVMLRFPEKDRHLGTLDTLKAITADGAIPVSHFMKRKAQPKEGVLHRSDSMRAITVKADVKEGKNANKIIAELSKKLPDLIKDPNIRVRFKGDQEDQKETAEFLSTAFLLALTAMFLVLLIQFNSFYRAGIIISAVFLAIIGVLIGLLVTGQAFGIVMCGVGVIALGGVVVNNNIIMIDTYRIIRQAEHSTKIAAVRAAVQRLRSVLLTAGTTVLGLIPMVLAMNINVMERSITFGAPSTQWWQQLATAIAGGLTFATILTLFLTPCLLSLERNKKQKDMIA